jgi:hypothetical protein
MRRLEEDVDSLSEPVGVGLGGLVGVGTGVGVDVDGCEVTCADICVGVTGVTVSTGRRVLMGA